MDMRAFYAQLKQLTIQPCYLLEGEEEYTKLKALDDLRSALLPEGMAMMNETVLTDPAADVLIATAETLPMMADRRLVIVRDSAHLQGRVEREEGESAAPSADGDRLVSYVQRLPDTTCLVFVTRGRANGTRKLYKQLNKQGAVVTFSRLSRPELIRWVARDLQALGKRITGDAAEELLFTAGEDMNLLRQEIEKLAAFAGDRDAITIHDIHAIATSTTEYKVFDLADAVMTGNAEKAVTLMNGMIRDGEARLFLLALLQGQCRQLFLCKLLGPNVRDAAVASALAVPPFVARKLLATSRRHTLSALIWSYEQCVDTEYRVKSGAQNEDGCLEMLVYQLLARFEQEAHDA